MHPIVELLFIIKDHICIIELYHKKEIRQLELELVQLPTDDDLQKYPMKMRELQQEIDNRNKIIKEMEDKMNGGGDTDDYEDELMRSSAEMEEVISSSPEQSKRSERSESSDEEPTGRDMFQSKKGEVWFRYRFVFRRNGIEKCDFWK